MRNEGHFMHKTVSLINRVLKTPYQLQDRTGDISSEETLENIKSELRCIGSDNSTVLLQHMLLRANVLESMADRYIQIGDSEDYQYQRTALFDKAFQTQVEANRLYELILTHQHTRLGN